MLYIIKPKIKGKIYIGPNINNTGGSHCSVPFIFTDVPRKKQQEFIKKLEEKGYTVKKLT